MKFFLCPIQQHPIKVIRDNKERESGFPSCFNWWWKKMGISFFLFNFQGFRDFVALKVLSHVGSFRWFYFILFFCCVSLFSLHLDMRGCKVKKCFLDNRTDCFCQLPRNKIKRNFYNCATYFDIFFFYFACGFLWLSLIPFVSIVLALSWYNN